jgi:hypothetical protein
LHRCAQAEVPALPFPWGPAPEVQDELRGLARISKRVYRSTL